MANYGININLYAYEGARPIRDKYGNWYFGIPLEHIRFDSEEKFAWLNVIALSRADTIGTLTHSLKQEAPGYKDMTEEERFNIPFCGYMGLLKRKGKK